MIASPAFPPTAEARAAIARAAARIGALQTRCAECAFALDQRRQPEAADLAAALAGELHALRRDLENAANVDDEVSADDVHAAGTFTD